MLIVYDSRTGNVKRFVEKTGLTCLRISEGLVISEPFVLVTYTTGFGKVPESTLRFLENNHKNLKGVASSGNRNWGQLFARAADIISEKYGVPIIHKFELSGTDNDIQKFIAGVKAIEVHRTEQQDYATR